MFFLPPGSDMQIGIIPQHSGYHHRVLNMLLIERGKFVVGLLIDHHMVVYPAYRALFGLHLVEPPVAPQDLQPVPVLNRGHPVRHCRQPIPQKRLLCRHIDIVIMRRRSKPSAPQKGKSGKNQRPK